MGLGTISCSGRDIVPSVDERLHLSHLKGYSPTFMHSNLASAQERSHTIEAQLSETTKQLHELRIRQRQLEARNALLEKVAKLNKQPSGEAPPEGLPSPTVPFSIQVFCKLLRRESKYKNVWMGIKTPCLITHDLLCSRLLFCAVACFGSGLLYLLFI